jgi:hypothetical protein
VCELGSGRSRIETARSLGIDFTMAPQMPLEDGINAVRMLFPRLYIDEERWPGGFGAVSAQLQQGDGRIQGVSPAR